MNYVKFYQIYQVNNVCTVYMSIINCDVFGVRNNGGKIHLTLTPQVLWSKLPEIFGA